jgi:hypothetical protein
MVFRIIVGVVVRVVAGGDEVYQHHSPRPTKNHPLPWSVEEDARGRHAVTVKDRYGEPERGGVNGSR